jgi:hypothetical protein
MKAITYASAITIFLTILFASFSFVIVESKPGDAVDTTTEILWFDDFETKTIKWLGVGSGSVTRTEFMAFSESASMNITAQTQNIEESLRQIGSYEYPLRTIVLDFWFSIPYQNLNNFAFGLEYCSANRDIWHRSAIVLPQGLIENQTGAWIPIQNYLMNLDQKDNYSVWHHANLKVDLHSGKYIQLTVDDYTLDLSSCDMYNRKMEGSPVLWGVIYPYFYTIASNGNCSVLVDDITLMLE